MYKQDDEDEQISFGDSEKKICIKTTLSDSQRTNSQPNDDDDNDNDVDAYQLSNEFCNIQTRLFSDST